MKDEYIDFRTKRLLFELEESIHRKFKIMCASEGKSMKSQLTELVEAFVLYKEEKAVPNDLAEFYREKEIKQKLIDAKKKDEEEKYWKRLSEEKAEHNRKLKWYEAKKEYRKKHKKKD